MYPGSPTAVLGLKGVDAHVRRDGTDSQGSTLAFLSCGMSSRKWHPLWTEYSES